MRCVLVFKGFTWAVLTITKQYLHKNTIDKHRAIAAGLLNDERRPYTKKIN